MVPLLLLLLQLLLPPLLLLLLLPLLVILLLQVLVQLLRRLVLLVLLVLPVVLLLSFAALTFPAITFSDRRMRSPVRTLVRMRALRAVGVVIQRVAGRFEVASQLLAAPDAVLAGMIRVVAAPWVLRATAWACVRVGRDV